MPERNHLTEARVEYVEVNGARLWTIRQGQGPAVVLCHGGPGMWDYLGPVADLLDDMATVYRYDQRACGRSSGGPPYDVETAVADLDALRQHWGIDRWVVGGHSWGATVALAYCLYQLDRASGLIYISGTGIDPAWHAEFHRNQDAALSPEERQELEEVKRRLRSAVEPERGALDRRLWELVLNADLRDRRAAVELADAIWADGVRTNLEVNRALGKDGARLMESDATREELSRLRVPALVIHGEEDLRPAWSARQVAEAIPGATYIEAPRARHFPWLDQPELFERTVRAFLQRVTAGDAETE